MPDYLGDDQRKENKDPDAEKEIIGMKTETDISKTL